MTEKLITPSVNGLFKKGKIMKIGHNMQWENNKANRWQIKKTKSKKELVKRFRYWHAGEKVEDQIC